MQKHLGKVLSRACKVQGQCQELKEVFALCFGGLVKMAAVRFQVHSMKNRLHSFRGV